MDEELSAEQRRVLEDALAGSDDLRAAAEQWPRLQNIVRNEPNIDHQKNTDHHNYEFVFEVENKQAS